eukprot:14415104-Alexandrium_andersonii.AAC.1
MLQAISTLRGWHSGAARHDLLRDPALPHQARLGPTSARHGHQSHRPSSQLAITRPPATRRSQHRGGPA